MIPYLFVFSLFSFSALSCQKIKAPISRWQLIVLTIFVGFRWEVGADWDAYFNYLREAEGLTFFEGMGLTDPGYAIVNWISANYLGSIFFLNSVCAAILMFGLYKFSLLTSFPRLIPVVGFPVLIVIVGMGFIRQSVSLGIFLLAIPELLRGRLGRYICFCILACLFHRSAFVLLFLGFLSNDNRWVTRLVICILGLLSCGYLLTYDLVEYATVHYLEGDFNSTGAWPRVNMTVVPCVIYLLFKSNFQNETTTGRFWTAMAISGLFLPVLLYFSPSSTLIDRFSVYWLPMQLMVYSDLLRLVRKGWRFAFKIGVVLYSFTILTAWFFWSSYSTYWTPYNIAW